MAGLERAGAEICHSFRFSRSAGFDPLQTQGGFGAVARISMRTTRSLDHGQQFVSLIGGPSSTPLVHLLVQSLFG
jgi:hypothetical protein